MMFPEGEVRHYRDQLSEYVTTIEEIAEPYQKRIIEIYEKHHASGDTQVAEDTQTGDSDIDAELEKAKSELRELAADPRVQELVRQGLTPAFEAVDMQFASDIQAITGVDPFLNDERLRPFIEDKIEENVQRIKTLPERHLDEVAEATRNAIDEGTSLKEFQEKIPRQEDHTEYNAERIARDQIGDVQGNMTIRRMKDAGMRVFRWSTVGDSRVRDGHRKLNGEVLPIDTGDTSGRSETGFPGLDIQCRCTPEIVIGEAERVYGGQRRNQEEDE